MHHQGQEPEQRFVHLIPVAHSRDKNNLTCPSFARPNGRQTGFSERLTTTKIPKKINEQARRNRSNTKRLATAGSPSLTNQTEDRRTKFRGSDPNINSI
jgi:hypothetical protein